MTANTVYEDYIRIASGALGTGYGLRLGGGLKHMVGASASIALSSPSGDTPVITMAGVDRIVDLIRLLHHTLYTLLTLIRR